jgi:hypothetical protein
MVNAEAARPGELRRILAGDSELQQEQDHGVAPAPPVSRVAALLRGSGGLKCLLVIVTSTSSVLRRVQTPIPCVLLAENDRSLESFSQHLKASTRWG